MAKRRSISRRTVLATLAAAAGGAAVEGVTTEATAERNSTPGPAIHSSRADVIVVGAGVFGAWTAWHLRKLGRKVLLLDAWGRGACARVLRRGIAHDADGVRPRRDLHALFVGLARRLALAIVPRVAADLPSSRRPVLLSARRTVCRRLHRSAQAARVSARDARSRSAGEAISADGLGWRGDRSV